MRSKTLGVIPLLFFVALKLMNRVVAAESANDDLLNRAKALYAGSNTPAAIVLLTQAIEAQALDVRPHLFRAQIYERNRELQKALVDYDQALKIDSNLAPAWQLRGLLHFKLAHIAESITDFDKFISLAPNQAPYHWQRGISCYYAGRFEEGRKQFELHQTVNPEDVENAVWHFLCVARLDGIEKARASLIPIKGDERVPMAQVYALFAGKTAAENVVKAVYSGDPPGTELQRRLFYAHLYLGLYAEATGDEGAAHEHIYKAAREFGAEDYMSYVARVHLILRDRPRTQHPTSEPQKTGDKK